MGRLLRQLFAHVVSKRAVMQALAMAIYLPVLLTHSAARSHMIRVTEPRVEVRAMGDPARALERIRDGSFTTVEHLNDLAGNPDLRPIDRLVYANAPLILKQPGILSQTQNVLLGLYYTTSVSTLEDGPSRTTIRYYLHFSNERGGMPLERRMARYGHPFDAELVYAATFEGERVLSAYYQGPNHRLIPFRHENGRHPIFAIASPNHNFRLVHRDDLPVLALLPQNDLNANRFHDPDFVALAALDALTQHRVDISQYVYVAFQNPVPRREVTISVRVRGRWYHLHEKLGTGVTVQGYHQVGVWVGFQPQPDDIEELRITIRGQRYPQPEIFAVYLYARPFVPA
jgi:hypothetical protein